MTDDDKRSGVGMPMFGRILFSPDEAAAGEEGPDVKMPTDALAADLAKLTPDAESVETPAASEETPAAPAASETPAPVEDKTDWKAEAEKLKTEREEYAQKIAEEARQQDLAKLASESPAFYERIYGVKPPPGMFKEEPKPVTPPAGATPNPTDQLAKDLADLKNWRVQREQAEAQAKAEAKQNAERQAQSERIYGAMAKHKDIFDHPTMGEYLSKLAVAEFVSTLNANPKAANPDLVAEGIAKAWKGTIEGVKAEYVNGKKQVAARIPVGAGTGGRQAGSPLKPRTLEEAEKAMANDLKNAERGEDD